MNLSDRVIITILALNLFFLRPAALGQDFTFLSLIIALAITVVSIVGIGIDRQLTYENKLLNDTKILFLLCLIYWVISAIQAIYFDRTNLDYLLKEIVSSLILMLCYAFFLNVKKWNSIFFNIFCLLVSILGWSSVITVLLSAFIDVSSLIIINLQITGYEHIRSDDGLTAGTILFPFSMLYTKMTTDSIVLLRFCNFFREAGIYQAIACFCITYEFFHRKSKLIIIGLIMGGIITFSSLGIVLLVITIFLCFVVNKKISSLKLAFSVIIILLTYPIALYTPIIGINDKSVTHSTSMTDRSEAMANGIYEIFQYPLGFGPYSGGVQNSSINMIAAIGQYGIINFLILCFILIGWRFNFSVGSLKKMSACLPLLITALISQPIVGAPLIYILTMAGFDEEFD